MHKAMFINLFTYQGYRVIYRNMKVIFTIGHSNQSLEDLIEKLEVNQIQKLYDVRSYPGSRHCPWFSRESLEVEIPKHSIEYEWYPNLGGRRKPIKPVPNTVSWWTHPSFSAYANYALTDEKFKHGLDVLINDTKRCCYMCSEAQWWRCHRRIISDWLTAYGVDVQHIMTNKPTQNTRHILSSGAFLEFEKVEYPGIKALDI